MFISNTPEFWKRNGRLAVVIRDCVFIKLKFYDILFAFMQISLVYFILASSTNLMFIQLCKAIDLLNYNMILYLLSTIFSSRGNAN